MPSINQQLSPNDSGSHTTRWVVIGIVIAAVVVGLVLLAIYGGSGSSAPGY